METVWYSHLNDQSEATLSYDEDGNRFPFCLWHDPTYYLNTDAPYEREWKTLKNSDKAIHKVTGRQAFKGSQFTIKGNEGETVQINGKTYAYTIDTSYLNLFVKEFAS